MNKSLIKEITSHIDSNHGFSEGFKLSRVKRGWDLFRKMKCDKSLFMFKASENCIGFIE